MGAYQHSIQLLQFAAIMIIKPLAFCFMSYMVLAKYTSLGQVPTQTLRDNNYSMRKSVLYFRVAGEKDDRTF